MFEQQQNTGKSTSLAEKYANAVGQLVYHHYSVRF